MVWLSGCVQESGFWWYSPIGLNSVYHKTWLLGLSSNIEQVGCRQPHKWYTFFFALRTGTLVRFVSPDAGSGCEMTWCAWCSQNGSDLAKWVNFFDLNTVDEFGVVCTIFILQLLLLSLSSYRSLFASLSFVVLVGIGCPCEHETLVTSWQWSFFRDDIVSCQCRSWKWVRMLSRNV
jgi:hypothetical protein